MTHQQALRDHGVVLLKGIFPQHSIANLRQSAEAADFTRCAAWRFTPFSYSILLPALLEFGVASREELLAPFAAGGLNRLITETLGEPAVCNLEESWLRKRFAPSNAPRHYRPNVWHQDGGLRAPYGPDPDSLIPMTRLLTCWVPLRACGHHCPGLEFVRQPLHRLLHYTELNDQNLRRRFAPDHFWAPELEFGDALLFLNGTLHRTHVLPEMKEDRLSLEYRFFPAG
jgi:hypothetical protein